MIRIRKHPSYKSTQKVLEWIGERDELALEYHKQLIKRRKKITLAFLRFKKFAELGPLGSPIGKIRAYIWLQDPHADDRIVVGTAFTPRKGVDTFASDTFIESIFEDSGLSEFMEGNGAGCSITGKRARDMTFCESPWKVKT